MIFDRIQMIIISIHFHLHNQVCNRISFRICNFVIGLFDKLNYIFIILFMTEIRLVSFLITVNTSKTGRNI
jgi:hypothetical protein